MCVQEAQAVVCGWSMGYVGPWGRWSLAVMLEGSDFILKAMGSYWKFLGMGTTKSDFRLGNITLAAVQTRSKGLKHEVGKLLRRLHLWRRGERRTS